MKKKGTAAERELLRMFWDNGWAALRTPGSGSARFPSPDIIAGNRVRRLAIECKTTKEVKKYIPKKEIAALLEFSGRFGAEPWVGVKLENRTWFFLPANDLAETARSCVVSLEVVKRQGLVFEELVTTI